ncbi:hypothetical protein BCR34DRAFT_599548 [Clohesyomyces aquaticus]|uniref:Uncharacterized protein n=1 Tax=Clohesyomyces aquaticus TaxID=1231657 RepID=A0A1Y1ZUL4_9PLEO|nr:hypothetical protein BCR34DRAFT_599548 [Clohesyomyces aquaticus]
MPEAGQLILHLLSRSLNILVSPGGDGSLLAELDSFTPHAREAQKSTPLLLFLIAGSLLVGLVRYTLGHTLANLLTLASLHIHNGREDGGVETPLSRHIVASLRLLYDRDGIRIFCKGLHMAVVYQLAMTAISTLLRFTLFRPEPLRPLARIVSMITLSNLHLSWTRATVLAGHMGRTDRTWGDGSRTWRILVVPAAGHGIASALLEYVSRSLPESATPVWDIPSISALAVLHVFMALVIHSLVLAPLSAWLTMVETSCLDPTKETLVYSKEKKRFLSVSAFFVDCNRPPNFGQFRKHISSRLCFWLLGLHVKKCLVQMILEGSIFAVVGFFV